MRSLFLLAVAGACMSSVEANVFLGRGAEHALVHESSLLEQLEHVLGSDHRLATEGRALRIADALRPTFAAMPQNSDGKLKSETVRYMVHRYFVDRHGWFVRGLDSAGSAWNSSSPAVIFKEYAGDNIHSIFEEKLCDDKGFSLNQVAVLAATLESFVHGETIERLHAAYNFAGLSQNEEHADVNQVTSVMETYMMMYVLGTNHSNATEADIEEVRSTLLDVYPTWGQTTTWMNQVREEVLGVDGDTSFNSTVRVLEELGDRYGRWQNSECLDLKESLVKLEKGDTGRVSLDAFYKSALEGNWQFSESVPYLRQLGALDETDENKLSIIIPNYVNSPSNCVASSKFYSVCCIDECETLLSHLEVNVAAPEAAPAEIVQLVSALPSATVEAPRTLSTSLVQRLEEIADHHGGTVPFHGRLFAQWMHHVYPRECQYPHLSGTTKPLGPEQWEKKTGDMSIADEETMRWHVSQGRSSRRASKTAEQGLNAEDELPWSAEEELFVGRPAIARLPWSVDAYVVLMIVHVVAIFTIAFILFRVVVSASVAAAETTAQQKYFV